MVITLEKIKTIIIWGVLLLLPIGVLPFFLDPVELPKLIILTIGVGLVLVLMAIEIMRSGRLNLSIGNFDLAVLLIILVYLIAGLTRTPNKMDAFFSPGTSSLVIASGIFYFLINQLSEKGKKNIWYILLGSGIILGIITLFELLGVFGKIPQLPDFLKSPLFSVAGDYLSVAIFLGLMVPFTLSSLIKIEDLPKKILIGFSLVIIVLALSLSIFNILPGKPTSPVIPDLTTSWAVAIESIKETPLWGVGPANYISAFNRFRPITYNATPLWPYRFSSGHNFYITAITETGLAGTLVLGILILLVVRALRSSLPKPDIALISLIAMLVILAFFPTSHLTTILFFILLALSAKTHKISFNLTANTVDSKSPAAKLPSLITGLVILLATVFLAVKASSVLAAEATFKSAFDALNKNDGKLTYDLLRSAINQNPLVDRYHASYAQINLALVRSITSQKKTLSDEDKTTVSQLVEQAVREGQATVALNQERAGNWEVLARIYQSIIPLAKDADQFAIQAYNQTITLDPINPNLRIALGGIYYSLGQWDNAIKTFELASFAKPDLANAHYNLAAAYRESGQIDKAISEMQIVLQLTQKDSQDYNLAKTELDNLQKKKTTAEPQQGESLTTPQKSGGPAISPQLQLPSEATPPAGPNLPSASPTPSPTSKP